MKIADLMTKNVLTCRQSADLTVATQLMWEHDCGAVPVVDDQGKLAGIVTDRDITMSAYFAGRALALIPVTDAMSKKVFSCRATDTVDLAERLMRDKQVRRIPVVDAENRPIGMLSLNDVARFVESKKKDGMEHELVRTLAAVCEPRPTSIAVRVDN